MHFKDFPFPQTLFRSDVPSVPDQDVCDPLEAKETRGAPSGSSVGPPSGLLIISIPILVIGVTISSRSGFGWSSVCSWSFHVLCIQGSHLHSFIIPGWADDVPLPPSCNSCSPGGSRTSCSASSTFKQPSSFSTLRSPLPLIIGGSTQSARAALPPPLLQWGSLHPKHPTLPLRPT